MSRVIIDQEKRSDEYKIRDEDSGGDDDNDFGGNDQSVTLTRILKQQEEIISTQNAIVTKHKE